VRSQDLKRAKRDLRRRVLAARDSQTSAEREAGSQALVERVLTLPEVADARTIMAFWSFGSELSTTPLIEALDARGATVALPIIVGGALEAHTYRPGEPTTVTHFGAREPAEGRRVDPQEIDIVITPGVAFDREGRRVGYGGGFYDRFLPLTRADAVRVGVCFALQLLDEDLPAGAFDLRVDVVVTPVEVVRCAR
jgi:5-formyltetrahydrofolate cyclo-ligase